MRGKGGALVLKYWKWLFARHYRLPDSNGYHTWIKAISFFLLSCVFVVFGALLFPWWCRYIPFFFLLVHDENAIAHCHKSSPALTLVRFSSITINTPCCEMTDKGSRGSLPMLLLPVISIQVCFFFLVAFYIFRQERRKRKITEEFQKVLGFSF